MQFMRVVTHRNGTQGMQARDSLQWHAWYVWNAGVQYKVQTHRNGMSGMRGMWTYSTKSNVRARDSLQWHGWYAGALTHRNGILGISRMLELTRFF